MVSSGRKGRDETRRDERTDGDDEIRFRKNFEVMGDQDTSLLGERTSGEAVNEELRDVSVDSGKLGKEKHPSATNGEDRGVKRSGSHGIVKKSNVGVGVDSSSKNHSS